MTITSIATQIDYTGNGITVAFAIPFPFDTSADIKVTQDGAAITTGFTITGGGGSAGTCTFDTAPASGVLITLLDNPELIQDHDYTRNDAFPAESHEQALDRLTRITKRLNNRINQGLRLADGVDVDSADLELSPLSNWASKYLAFDANGKPTPALLSATTMTQSIIGGLLYPQTAAESDVALIPADFAYGTAPEVIQRLGGDGGGAVDNTTPITNAKTLSGSSYFPRGTYRISNNLTLDAAYAPIFEGLALWKPDAAKTISIAGPISAGNQKIFDLSNAGSIVTITNQLVNASWFGVIADGNYITGAGTDNSSAFQKAINALATAGGGALYVPPGIYKLSSQIVIPDGVTVYGAGKWSTILFAPTAFANLGGLVRISGVNGNPTCFHGISVLGQQGGAGGNGLVSVKNGVFISDIWCAAFNANVGITISQTDNFLFDFAVELNAYGVNCTQSHCNISNGTTYSNTSGGILVANGSAGEDGRITISNVRSSAENVVGFIVSAGKRVTIDACSCAHTTNAKYTTAGVQIDASSDVIINSFHGFLGSTSTTAAAILLSGTSNNIQVNGGGARGFQDGLRALSAASLNVCGGLYSNNGRYGAYLSGCDVGGIKAATANSNGTTGIYVDASVAGSKVSIIGNDVHANTSYGITANCAATANINMVGNTGRANGVANFNKTGTTANINDVGNY